MSVDDPSGGPSWPGEPLASIAGSSLLGDTPKPPPERQRVRCCVALRAPQKGGVGGWGGLVSAWYQRGPLSNQCQTGCWPGGCRLSAKNTSVINYPNFVKYWRARSRLDRSRSLQVKIHVAAFFKMYHVIRALLHRSNFKTSSSFVNVYLFPSFFFVSVSSQICKMLTKC